MREYKEDLILAELEIFRWSLYNAKKGDVKGKQQLLLDEACRNPINEPFIEECLIAGCNTNVSNDETRAKVAEFVENADLPSIRRRDEKYWDLSRLHICLAYRNEKLFIKGLELIAEKNPVKLGQILTKCDDLLYSAASNNLSLAIEKLVTFDANVTEVALLCACKFAAYESLETLLKYRDPGENITLMLKELSNAWQNRADANREDFEKCYELLLKRNGTDVNYVDKSGHSVMYYVRNQSDKVSECLEMGAYIGMQNDEFRPDVAFIPPELLKTHFDNCIQLISQNDVSTGKKNEIIEFDLKNLIPSESCKDVASNEMNAIEFMSNSEDHRHLVSHPLIWTFISLKWNQLALVYYMDFYLYLLFALLNMGCILISFEKSSDYIKVPFIILTAIFTIYVALRWVSHLIFCSSPYRKSWANLMQCIHTLLIIYFVVLVLLGVFQGINHTVAAISVLLIALKLFILAGSIFWTFSQFFLMFLNVAWSSIKSLQLCIIFIPSFLMSYYLLINDRNSKEKQHDKILEESKTVEEFKTGFFDFLYEVLHPGANKVDPTTLEEFKIEFFKNLPKILKESKESDEKTVLSSLVKTIMTWHNELTDRISSFDLSTLGFVVVLITLLSIIFMNLMNGLAVNDANRIQSEAELTSLLQRCHLLARYEEALSSRKHWFRKKFQKTSIMNLFEYFTQFESLEYMRHTNDRKIYVSLKSEIIHQIISEKVQKTPEKPQYKTKEKVDAKLALDMLFKSTIKNKARKLSNSNEFDVGLKKLLLQGNSRLWRTFVKSFPFFDERETINPQIVQLARQIIETSEIDKKSKEEQSHYKEQIANIQCNMEVLLRNLSKLDTIDHVNRQILEKLMNIENKIKISVD